MSETALAHTPQMPAAPEATLAEFDRFRSLFGTLIEHTLSFLEPIKDAEAYRAIPLDSEVNYLGTRVNKITIGGLVRHLILAESHWFESLLSIEDGGTIPFPSNASLLAGIEDGAPLAAALRQSWTKAQALLDRYTVDCLDKQVSFAGRHYSVMGMLWTMHGHHAFHLGQIDLLMRQQSIEPPEYMEWPETESVLG